MSNITNTFNNIEKYTIDDLEKSNVLASYESFTGTFKIKGHPDVNLSSPEIQKIFYLFKRIESSKDNDVIILVNEKSINNTQYATFKRRLNENGYNLTTYVISSESYESYAETEKLKSKSMDTEYETHDFINEFVKASVERNASDIHIEIRDKIARIRFKINGSLQIYLDWVDKQNVLNATRVLYTVLAQEKDKTFDETKNQQAIVPISIIDSKGKKRKLRLRLQTLRHLSSGVDVVMRVIEMKVEDREQEIDFEKLGYTNQQAKLIKRLIARPIGSTVIAGITGSGKSTTLKNMIIYINQKNNFEKKIYTIEDPPEYELPDVTQVPILRQSGDKDEVIKARILDVMKGCMRADPDVLIPGEIRDAETTNLFKSANQSGHQVLSTIHTTSAVGIIPRLEGFNLNYRDMAMPDFLVCLIYQKLVKKLCPHCSISYQEFNQKTSNTANEDIVEMIERFKKIAKDEEELEQIRFQNEDGCSHCKGGILGRTVAAEIIEVDRAARGFIEKGQISELEDYWLNLSDKKWGTENMVGKTVAQHGVQKVFAGIVDPREVEREFMTIDQISLYRELIKNEEAEERDIDSRKAFTQINLD